MTSLLSCEQLVAGYGSIEIVHAMDLDVAAGSVHAILGPNGSGKTTLMMTIAGLLPRQGGTVSVDGKMLPPRIGSHHQRAASAGQNPQRLEKRGFIRLVLWTGFLGSQGYATYDVGGIRWSEAAVGDRGGNR